MRKKIEKKMEKKKDCSGIVVGRGVGWAMNGSKEVRKQRPQIQPSVLRAPSFIFHREVDAPPSLPTPTPPPPPPPPPSPPPPTPTPIQLLSPSQLPIFLS
ncbi:hypothetical protein M0802_000361 [Mischocyttarus mexicanus]|nr:hypothetical protein M0802_000361 [Mischocyttarus mexicanus]